MLGWIVGGSALALAYLVIGIDQGKRKIDRKYLTAGGYALRLALFALFWPAILVIWWMAEYL
jgi:hypothetical protein